MIGYDKRKFRGRSYSSNGEVDGETLFYYHQDGDLLWGEYAGGLILSGHIEGTVHDGGPLTFLCHHRNTERACAKILQGPGRYIDPLWGRPAHSGSPEPDYR